MDWGWELGTLDQCRLPGGVVCACLACPGVSGLARVWTARPFVDTFLS